jgi:hypothetical protein
MRRTLLRRLPRLRRRRPRTTVRELIANNDAKPPMTMEEFAALGAHIFESDEEVDDFIAFTYAERRRDMA